MQISSEIPRLEFNFFRLICFSIYNRKQLRMEHESRVSTELPTCWLSADEGLAPWRWMHGRRGAKLPTSSSSATTIWFAAKENERPMGKPRESPKQAGGLGMADGHGPYVGPTRITNY